MSRYFVVSDIHGHYTLLREALNEAGFDAENENHILVCCGDYFDRGDENVEVLKFFERLKHKVLLRGNHEDMLLKIFETGQMKPHNFLNGTLKTVESFFGKYCLDPIDNSLDFSGKTGTLDRICDFINETADFFETEKYVFVHGWLPENAVTSQARQNASKKAWERARWIKWTDQYIGERPLADKTLVCGHVPTFFAYRVDSRRDASNADIYYGNGLIAVDAGVFDTQRVNVLVLEE